MTSRDFTGSLLSAIARFSYDRRGVGATIVAIALPGLIGFSALGVETGLWYTIKLQNQSAADAAAISAAYQVIADKTSVTDNLIPAASEAAAQNGYSGSTPSVIYPYSDSIVSNGVAVTLQQTQPGLLGSMFLPSVTISTEAVAVVKALDNLCILALATTGTGIVFGNSSSLDAPDCAVGANSTSTSAIGIQGDIGSITAVTLVTAGGITFNGDPVDPATPPSELILTSRSQIGAPSIRDPYARILTHAFLSSGIPATPAATHTWTDVTATITPGLYDGGMSFGANANVDLTPGVYYVKNGGFFVASGATVTCVTCRDADGVTIVLTTPDPSGGAIGNAQIQKGSTVTLQAPNSARFSGLLLVQDPLAGNGDGSDSAFEGGLGMSLTGLLYFPNAAVGFRGNPSATCTLLVARQVTIHSSSHLSTVGCSAAGLTNLPTVYTAALAE
jgi:Flp pilus assembly protein TadG